MKVLFWNIRGFGRPARRQIKEYIRDEALDGVELQETIKKDFTHIELTALVGGNHFKWVWKEASGHSGGILMGVRVDSIEIEDAEVGEHYVSMVLRNMINNFRWELITIYGPAHHDRIPKFIAELSRKCLCATLPLVLGGWDFNLIRHSREKNNCNVNQNLMDHFNMFIDAYQLQEIRRNGPKFTWTNKQVSPVMVTLDRILVSTEWELKRPLCFAWSKTRVGLDHSPLILDSGDNVVQKQKYFFFEKQWLLEEDFKRIFEENWKSTRIRFSDQRYAMDIWHGCISMSRQYLRGWNANKASEGRKKEEGNFVSTESHGYPE
jgi:hypothetical protein